MSVNLMGSLAELASLKQLDQEIVCKNKRDKNGDGSSRCSHDGAPYLPCSLYHCLGGFKPQAPEAVYILQYHDRGIQQHPAALSRPVTQLTLIHQAFGQQRPQCLIVMQINNQVDASLIAGILQSMRKGKIAIPQFTRLPDTVLMTNLKTYFGAGNNGYVQPDYFGIHAVPKITMPEYLLARCQLQNTHRILRRKVYLAAF